MPFVTSVDVAALSSSFTTPHPPTHHREWTHKNRLLEKTVGPKKENECAPILFWAFSEKRIIALSC